MALAVAARAHTLETMVGGAAVVARRRLYKQSSRNKASSPSRWRTGRIPPYAGGRARCRAWWKVTACPRGARCPTPRIARRSIPCASSSATTTPQRRSTVFSRGLSHRPHRRPAHPRRALRPYPGLGVPDRRGSLEHTRRARPTSQRLHRLMDQAAHVLTTRRTACRSTTGATTSCCAREELPDKLGAVLHRPTARTAGGRDAHGARGVSARSRA